VGEGLECAASGGPCCHSVSRLIHHHCDKNDYSVVDASMKREDLLYVGMIYVHTKL
jgi:hypothetical protein